MPDDRIETVIDRFLEYIRQNRKVSLKQASAALALPAERGEQLASLLESNNLIELHYGLTDIELVSKQKPGEKIEKKELARETGKGGAIERSKQLEHEILTAEGLLKFFEKDLERRILKSEQLLAELESKDGLTEGEISTVKQEIALILGQLAAFSSEVKELVDKEEKFYSKLEDFNNKLDALKPAKEKIEEKKKMSFPTNSDVLQLLRGFVSWLRGLASSLKKVKLNLPRATAGKQGKTLHPKRTRREPAVMYLGSGSEGWGQAAGRQTAGKQLGKTAKPRKRILEVRVDRVKQHYWRKSK